MANILKDKVIIVTGAGGGVGEHIAKEAARQGGRVIVNDIGKDEAGNFTAESITQAIIEAGGQALASTANIADWASAESLIHQAVDNWGRLDAIINNAGILRDKIFHKMSEAEWDQSLLVNLKACFNTSRLAAPIFKEQKGGALVHMTSTSGLIGNFGQANYSASKMGLVGLSKSIALDMQRYNVRSNCIAPFAMTPMIMAGLPRKTEDDEKRWRIFERMQPDRIAPLACALISDAGKDISGQIFSVRGNEIFLFSQPRPIRGAHIGTQEGITTQAVIERVFPMFKPSMYPLERSIDIFAWDPV